MSLIDVGIAATLMGFFTGIGLAIDNLVLPHQAARLRTRLLYWWNYVDDVKFRDVAHEMVSAYLKAEKKIFGQFPSYRWLLIAITISLVVSTFAIIFGRAAGLFFSMACNDTLEHFGGTLGTIKTSIKISWGWFRWNVGKTNIIILNVVFDALTLSATLLFLRKYVSSNLFSIRYFIIILDILACFLFFYFCVSLAMTIDRTTSMGSEKLEFLSLYNSIRNVGINDCMFYHVYLSAMIFSSTIFLPTVTYLLMIFTLMTAKISLDSAKWISAHILELSSVGQKTVFYYSGVFLGIITSLVKLIYYIGKMVV